MLRQCMGRHMRKNKTEQLKRYLRLYILLSFDKGSGCKCFPVLNKWNLYEERHIRKGKNPVRLTCSCTLLNSGRGSVYKCQFDHRSLYLYKGRRSYIGTTDCCFYDCTRRHFDMDSDCKYQFSHRIVSHRKDGCSRTWSNAEISPYWCKCQSFCKVSQHNCLFEFDKLHLWTAQRRYTNKTANLKRYMRSRILPSFCKGSDCKCFQTLNRSHLYVDRNTRKCRKEELTLLLYILQSCMDSVNTCSTLNYMSTLYTERRSCTGTIDHGVLR